MSHISTTSPFRSQPFRVPYDHAQPLDVLRRSDVQPALGLIPRPQPGFVEASLETSPIPAWLPVAVTDPTVGSIHYTNGTEPNALAQSLKDAHLRIIAIRHGQSAANAQGPVLSGQSETPLTPTGREQAKAVAGTLYDTLGGDDFLCQAAEDPQKLPVIFAGPLSRAQDTAQATVDNLKAQVDRLMLAGRIEPHAGEALKAAIHIETDPRLTEMGFGDLEMHTVDQAQQAYPQFAKAWDAFGGDGVDFIHRFPHGESRIDVMDRMSHVFNDLVHNDAGRTVLLFSHGEAINAAAATLGQSEFTASGDLHAGTAHVPNGVPHPLGMGEAVVIPLGYSPS